LPGVKKNRVGHTVGEVANATHRNHEEHAEAIRRFHRRSKTQTEEHK
jgi:hypothetical protein